MRALVPMLFAICVVGCVAAGCAGSPEPASGEALDEVIANPCSFASDGVYCGASLPSPPVGINTNHLYTCSGRLDKEEKNCPSSCSIQPSGVPDRCNPDPCAHASNGKFCGLSTQQGFSAASASSFVVYTCSGGRTTASQFCDHACVVAPPGTPDHC